MITPAKDFKESNYGKSWTDVVDSEQFRAAAQAALLEYMKEAKSFDEIQGAQNFLRKLMGLCDVQQVKRVDLSPNLRQPQ